MRSKGNNKEKHLGEYQATLTTQMLVFSISCPRVNVCTLLYFAMQCNLPSYSVVHYLLLTFRNINLVCKSTFMNSFLPGITFISQQCGAGGQNGQKQ